MTEEEKNRMAFDAYLSARAEEENIKAQEKAYNENLDAEYEARKRAADRRDGERLKYERYAAAGKEAYNKKVEDYQNQQKNINKANNQSIYGTDFNLENPANLEERRARANYWAQKNLFTILMGIATGKRKKFNNLWEKYRHAITDEQKRQIVEEMEKLYPTKKRAVDKVKQQQKGRSI